MNGRSSQGRYVLDNCASTTKPSSSSSWSSEARIAQGTSLSHPPNLRPGKKEGVLPLFKYFTKSITFQILPQSDIFPTHTVNLWTFWALGRSRGLSAQPIWWPGPIRAHRCPWRSAPICTLSISASKIRHLLVVLLNCPLRGWDLRVSSLSKKENWIPLNWKISRTRKLLWDWHIRKLSFWKVGDVKMWKCHVVGNCSNKDEKRGSMRWFCVKSLSVVPVGFMFC